MEFSYLSSQVNYSTLHELNISYSSTIISYSSTIIKLLLNYVVVQYYLNNRRVINFVFSLVLDTLFFI